MSSDVAAGVLAPGLRRTTAGVVLAVSLVAFEQLAVVTVAPAAAADVGAPGLHGWLFTAFLLAQLLGAAAAGRMADRHGVTLPLRAALVVAVAGIVVAAAAQDIGTLLLGRVLQGVGGGGLVTGVYATISTAYPPRLRPRMLSVFASAFVLPALAGPVVAVAVASAWGWRAVFLVLLPLAVAAVPCLVARRPADDTADGEPAGLRPVPGSTAVALALGTGAFVAGLQLGLAHPAAVPLAVAGAVVAGVALRVVLPRGALVLAAGLPAAVAAKGLFAAAYFAVQVHLAAFLDPAAAAVVLAAGAVTFPAAAFVHERLDARAGGRGRPRRAASAAVVVAAGAVATGALAGAGADAGWLLLVWTATSGGMGAGNAASATAAFAQAPAGGEGRVSAAVLLAELVGPAASIGVMGVLLAAGAAPVAVFAVAGSLALLAAVAAIRMDRA